MAVIFFLVGQFDGQAQRVIEGNGHQRHFNQDLRLTAIQLLQQHFELGVELLRPHCDDRVRMFIVSQREILALDSR